MVHHLIHIHTIRARYHHQTGRVLVIRLVTQVVHHRQLFIAHLGSDLLQHPRPGNLVRQGGNHHRTVLFFPHRAHAHGAATVLVNFADLSPGGDDLCFGRVVRPLDDIQQLIEGGLRLVDERNGRLGHFAQVVRRNVRRHANGDPGGAVQQNVWQASRQHFRLLHRAVKVRHPINRPLPQLTQQQLGVFGEARLGVTHRREGFWIVRRAPVPLAVNQRIAVGERLGHQHHGFIAGAVAVGMVFTQHVAHGTGGFFKLRAGVEAQFRHGVHDTPLHRLQAVADKRQRTIHDDVHGVV